jgi:hypothetical protein
MAKNRIKQMADKGILEREFQVGDWGFLKLQPYRQVTVVLRKKYKVESNAFWSL